MIYLLPISNVRISKLFSTSIARSGLDLRVPLVLDHPDHPLVSSSHAAHSGE